MTLELKTVDVHAVLKDALATVRAELEEKKIALVMECAAAHHVAEADSARLQQVFLERAEERREVHPAHGRIRVETRSLTEPNEMTVT
jgi:signal transduction histidine kinase